MIQVQLEVRGLKEATARLSRMERRVKGLSADKVAGKAMASLQRYAAGISPVVTGAYQGSHMVTMDRWKATLSIDPSATNPTSGVLVTRYAGAVEDRYAVYGRTGEMAAGMADQIAEEIAREVLS